MPRITPFHVARQNRMNPILPPSQDPIFGPTCVQLGPASSRSATPIRHLTLLRFTIARPHGPVPIPGPGLPTRSPVLKPLPSEGKQ